MTLAPFFLAPERIVQSWDTANKATELADYSVCTSWGIKNNHYYLIDVFRRKLNYPELKRAVRAQAHAFGAETVLIEDRASGTQLIQELMQEGLSRVTKITPDADKVMRLHAQTGKIENGFVHLPRTAPWLEDYLAELMSFPRSRHDDQVDSTSQALAWLAIPNAMEPWLAQMRAARGRDPLDRPPLPPPVRVTEPICDPQTGKFLGTRTCTQQQPAWGECADRR